jgi:hypothetical protein
MDPQTGEYKVALTEEEKEFGVDLEDEAPEEVDDDLLRQFAKTIGLDDQDVDDSLMKKMR